MTAIELTAYVDESGTHDGSPYTVMAAWVGYAERWEKFEAAWRGLLVKSNLPYIHAVDLRHGKKLFKDKRIWPLRRRLALAQEATQLVQDHAIYSMSVILKNGDYDAHYIGDDQRLRKHRAAIDSKYGVCFRVLLSLLARITQQYGTSDSLVHIVLESGHKNKGAAQDILDLMFELAPDLAKFVGPAVTYALKEKCPGVQAADLLAYPTFVLEREGTASYTNFESGMPEEWPEQEFSYFRVPILEDTLKDIKTGQIAHADFRRTLGPHWQQLDGFPIGWTVRSLKSFDGFVLIPPAGEANPENLEPAHYVHPKSS